MTIIKMINILFKETVVSDRYDMVMIKKCLVQEIKFTDTLLYYVSLRKTFGSGSGVYTRRGYLGNWDDLPATVKMMSDFERKNASWIMRR